MQPRCKLGKTLGSSGAQQKSGGGGVALVGALCSGLLACLEGGLTVTVYIWQDTCPCARAVAAELLPKLLQRYPGQLSPRAIQYSSHVCPATGQPGAD